MDNLPLGNFDSNCNQIAQQVVMQPTQVDFNVFNSGRFFEIIKNIDTLTEEQIEGVIDTYLDVIVEKTLSDDSRMGTILCNPKFVNAYCRVMRRTSIDFERRLFCNKLTYEYGIVDGHNEVILNKFREISAYVNHHQIIKLAGRGIPKKIAEDLVTCRFSSRHENVNVQRLNVKYLLNRESSGFMRISLTESLISSSIRCSKSILKENLMISEQTLVISMVISLLPFWLS